MDITANTVRKRNEEQKKAEQLKKELYYDPDTCSHMDESGCCYPDCDNCGVDLEEEEG